MGLGAEQSERESGFEGRVFEAKIISKSKLV